MERKQKDLNVPDPLDICGDGSCGCGLPMERDKVLSQEEIQKIRSSSDEEPLGTTGNPTGKKGGKK